MPNISAIRHRRSARNGFALLTMLNIVTTSWPPYKSSEVERYFYLLNILANRYSCSTSNCLGTAYDCSFHDPKIVIWDQRYNFGFWTSVVNIPVVSLLQPWSISGRLATFHIRSSSVRHKLSHLATASVVDDESFSKYFIFYFLVNICQRLTLAGQLYNMAISCFLL